MHNLELLLIISSPYYHEKKKRTEKEILAIERERIVQSGGTTLTDMMVKLYLKDSFLSSQSCWEFISF